MRSLMRERLPVGAYPRPGVVPYIVMWSAERTPWPVVEAGSPGVRLKGERSHHRDADGVVWKPQLSAPGRGEPLFARVHGVRQRRAMAHLLCQVCGRPADRDARGVLWLVDGELRKAAVRRGRLETVHPPLCLACARTSVELCPHLRRSWAALRVGAVRRVGVFGALYRPGARGPEAAASARVRYGDSDMAWVVGSQSVLRLLDYEVVDLDTEGSAVS